MNFGFDGAGLESLFNDLNTAGAKVVPVVRGVVNRGALNVKSDARRLFEEQRVGDYLPHYSRSITYDVESAGGFVSAEVGPEVGKVQGPFGPGVEFGSVNHAAMPHLAPALDAEEPRFVGQWGDAAVGLLL